MKCDPKFATSPIFIDDKDYEFSIDPELITLVESDDELETVNTETPTRTSPPIYELPKV